VADGQPLGSARRATAIRRAEQWHCPGRQDRMGPARVLRFSDSPDGSREQHRDEEHKSSDEAGKGASVR